MTRRIFAFGFVGAALVRAETPAERGKRIVADTVQALGGDAFRTMRTRTESGRAYSFVREELSGLALAKFYTKYLPPTGKDEVCQVQRQMYGKKEDDIVLVRADDAYELTFRGARPLAPDKLKQSRESTLHDVLYILRQRLGEPGISFEASADDVVENQPVHTLDIYDAAQRRVTVWIHSSTGMPVKQRFYRIDPITKQKREEITRLTKYRDVGNGAMWPYGIQRERDTEKLFELYSEHVKINEAIDEKLFELPRGMKILPRGRALGS